MKTIDNVGILDLRTATEDAVAQIRRIGNVGAILYTPETAPLIPRLAIGNVGATVQVAADARLASGQLEIDGSYFEGGGDPVELVAVGQITLHPDVSAEQLKRGLASLIVVGQVRYPDTLAGALQAKVRDSAGQLQSYPWTEGARFHPGGLRLDLAGLQALPDGSKLVVLGTVSLPEVVDETLLERKVASLYVGGKLQCREENLVALRARLHERSPSPSTSVVPAGFEPVERRLRLDAATLGSLPSRKLYCTGVVEVAPEVEAQALEAAFDALRVTRLLIAPAALKSALTARCDMLSTKAVFYEGELWHIEDDAQLPASRFDYLQGQATLLVRGDLTIGADVEPQVLAERLHKVHNLGSITCTPAQMGAVQARLGLSEGELVDATRPAQPSDEDHIGNAGSLRL